jgi:hypothetical protein
MKPRTKSRRPFFVERHARLLVVAAGLSAVAADCQTCQQTVTATRGNLDRVADVVVVDANDGHGYAIAANPELEHLRVLDLTDGRFLSGPNRFFPLSIPTGPSTRQLAVAVAVADDGTTRADPRRVFALDGSDDTVSVIAVVDDDAGVAPFTVLDTLPTGPAPVDLAAIVRGTTTAIAVTVPYATVDGEGALELSTLDDGVPVGDAAPVIIALPAGSHPSAVVADPFGRSFVVADAALSELHIVERDETTGAYAYARSLDVQGPCSELAAGVVDVGDGLAPVVLALRSDTAAAVAVRLYRPGFREDRYAVLGGAELPSLGVTATVADARPGEQPATGDAAAVTVCCRGLSEDRIAAGEATAAFATVHQANGQLVYLQLAAASVDDLTLPPGRRVVRLVDDDGAPASAPDGTDLNADAALWLPEEGGEALRPVVALASVDNYGSPPFVPLLPAGLVLDLVWEGDVPGLSSLRGAFAPGPHTFTAHVDVEARDGRVGDVARLVPEAPLAGCDDAYRARILAVDGATVTVAVDGDGSGATPALDDTAVTSCLQGTGEIRLTVEAQGAFVVTDAHGFVARLAPADAGSAPDVDAGTALRLPGVELSLTTPAGTPRAGSALLVPLDAHVATMGLDLSATAIEGGFGSAALVPTGLATATITIPDASSDVDGAVVEARRMVLTTASVSTSSGLPVVYTCDEGETSTGRVETFE